MRRSHRSRVRRQHSFSLGGLGWRAVAIARRPSASPAARATRSLGLAAEEEVVRQLLAVPRGATDQHVLRDAAQVVDHVAIDEARQADVVRLDRRPARRMRRRHAAGSRWPPARRPRGGRRSSRVRSARRAPGGCSPRAGRSPRSLGGRQKRFWKSVKAGSEFLPWKITSRSGGASGGTRSVERDRSAPAARVPQRALERGAAERR